MFFGTKARNRASLYFPNALSAYALAPPGCNFRNARPSWQRVIDEIKRSRGDKVVHPSIQEDQSEQRTPRRENPDLNFPVVQSPVPAGVDWKDCIIRIMDEGEPPGEQGSTRRIKNELARQFDGHPVQMWMDEVNRRFPQYRLTKNNANMCIEKRYLLLETPDGRIVNFVP